MNKFTAAIAASLLAIPVSAEATADEHEPAATQPAEEAHDGTTPTGTADPTVKDNIISDFFGQGGQGAYPGSPEYYYDYSQYPNGYQAYPQGYQQGYPQGYPRNYPQGNQQAYPQGYPRYPVNPQGQPQQAQANPYGYYGYPEGYYPYYPPPGYAVPSAPAATPAAPSHAPASPVPNFTTTSEGQVAPPAATSV